MNLRFVLLPVMHKQMHVLSDSSVTISHKYCHYHWGSSAQPFFFFFQKHLLLCFWFARFFYFVCLFFVCSFLYLHFVWCKLPMMVLNILWAARCEKYLQSEAIFISNALLNMSFLVQFILNSTLQIFSGYLPQGIAQKAHEANTFFFWILHGRKTLEICKLQPD